MILRKPYAFLIKKFKLIHMLLSVLMAFLLYKSYSVYSFFNNYLKEAKFNVIDNISSKYITPTMYIVTIFIIAITITIIVLMNFKKKPIKYYFISTITYFIFIFVFIFAFNELKQIEWNELNIQMIKITRDILFVTYLIQIPFIVINIIRATGFNIKKFNFEKDLRELNIDNDDNEEFELDLQLNSDEVKTSFRRRIRIIKYVIKENKYLLLIFISIVMIISGTLIYAQQELFNKIYDENEILNTANFKIKVLDSYQLDTNTNGNDITLGKYSFTVVRLSLTNKTEENLSISLENFRIRTDEFTTYKPNTDNYKSFIEFGKGYSGEQIPSNDTKEYIIVFKVNKEEKDKDKILEYLTGGKRKDGELILNYAKFKLNTNFLDKKETIVTTSLNDKIDFNKSLLKESSIVIKKVEFKKSYTDKYKKCIGKKCYDINTYIIPKDTNKYDKIIMKVDYDLTLDQNINSSEISDQFISKFANLRYVIKDREYFHNINLIDVTPSEIKGYSYLEVKSEVKEASNIYLDFKIRDKIYTYIIK